LIVKYLRTGNEVDGHLRKIIKNLYYLKTPIYPHLGSTGVLVVMVIILLSIQSKVSYELSGIVFTIEFDYIPIISGW
jgi:hypothetical protein